VASNWVSRISFFVCLSTSCHGFVEFYLGNLFSFYANQITARKNSQKMFQICFGAFKHFPFQFFYCLPTYKRAYM